MSSLDASVLDKPLPKPRRSRLGYASARALEALLEALLAIEFLEHGYTRNAAGKAFQAWRALLGTLLALEKDSAVEKLGKDERRWLEERAIPLIPSSRLKPLAQLLERLGYRGLSQATSMARELHSYQYNGPDPAGELSGYPSRESAATDIILLLEQLTSIIEGRVKSKLEDKGLWTVEHSRALEELKQRLRHGQVVGPVSAS